MSSTIQAGTHVAIMGDLVGSEAVASINDLHRTFNGAIEDLNLSRQRDLASPLTVTLGDEFQGLCRSLGSGLSIVRTLRRRLLAGRVECRFVLGVVTIETPLNVGRAWNMMGPGLADTRRKLANKRHANAYRFFLPGERLAESLLEAVCLSITDIEAHWTVRQSEIVAASFDHRGGNRALADELGISERALYKVRRAARLDFYENQWNAVEHAMDDLDARYGFR